MLQFNLYGPLQILFFVLLSSRNTFFATPIFLCE